MSDELKVLIVDDEPPARKKLQTLLKDVPQKFVIDEAANGLEGG